MKKIILIIIIIIVGIGFIIPFIGHYYVQEGDIVIYKKVTIYQYLKAMLSGPTPCEGYCGGTQY